MNRKLQFSTAIAYRETNRATDRLANYVMEITQKIMFFEAAWPQGNFVPLYGGQGWSSLEVGGEKYMLLLHGVFLVLAPSFNQLCYLCFIFVF